MRVLYFGMDGRFSVPPLTALLHAGHTIVGVVVPRPQIAGSDIFQPLVQLHAPRRPRVDIPLTAAPVEPTIIGLAWEARIPVFEVRRLRHPDTLATLADLQSDAIAVACFPRLLPPSLLDLPRLGAFNVHPSLLPRRRGPEPLFWTFHDGLEHAGVTVHLMDTGADTGPIAAQSRVALPDGISYSQAQRALAEAGATLLVHVLDQAEKGTLDLRAQDNTQASPAPLPTVDNFVVGADWSPRRTANFTAGLAEWGQPIYQILGDQRIQVTFTTV